MLCDWGNAWTIRLVILLYFELLLVVTGISKRLDHRWVQPITFTCLDWLCINLQALHESLIEVINATHNASQLKSRNFSPQLIVFPKIKHLSKYEKPTNTQRVEFLSLPLEIRLKIYRLFFATEAYNPFEQGNDVYSDYKAISFISRLFLVPTPLTCYWPIVKIQHSKGATANSKVPLLLTNKNINIEARPLFYRHHTFKFECGIRRFGIPKIYLAQRAYRSLDWMTKMELTNSEHYFPYNPQATLFHHQLRLLSMSCSRLRSLKLDYHMSPREKPLPMIPDLWVRLVHIEMRITSWAYMGDEMMLQRLEPIAAAKDWRKVGVNDLDGYYLRSNGAKALVLDVPQHIFKLDRPEQEKIGEWHSSW